MKAVLSLIAMLSLVAVPAHAQVLQTSGNSQSSKNLQRDSVFQKLISPLIENPNLQAAPVTKRAYKDYKYSRRFTGLPQTAVRAAASGTVVFNGWYGGYGKVVIIRHEDNVTTLYAHLHNIFVETNQQVEKGAVVGAIGSTGFAAEPHLCFEVRFGS